MLLLGTLITIGVKSELSGVYVKICSTTFILRNRLSKGGSHVKSAYLNCLYLEKPTEYIIRWMTENNNTAFAALIAENLAAIRKNIKAAAERSKRDPAEITMVAVTKKIGVEAISVALLHGVELLGENRLQEAKEKFEQIGDKAEWHFIGHLQKNKVKYLFDIFTLVHSVDSIELAKEIDRKAKGRGMVIDILLQVNVGIEETKHGFHPDLVAGEAGEIAALPNLRVRGLMAIPPKVANSEESRPFFKKIMEIKSKISGMNLANCPMDIASFGMSGDYEVAIEEGATHIRIGRAIFGGRNA